MPYRMKVRREWTLTRVPEMDELRDVRPVSDVANHLTQSAIYRWSSLAIPE